MAIESKTYLSSHNTPQVVIGFSFHSVELVFGPVIAVVAVVVDY